MAFFRQLQLLLWKNGLGIIRQPFWSVTLIIWPLIIFILIAVTRHQFPPVVKDACYVGPRNLPSTGLLPFLQTLMCNTDSSCHNTSLFVDPATSKSSRTKRSTYFPKTSPLATLIQGGEYFNFGFPNDSSNDPAQLVRLMENIFGSSHQGNQNAISLMNVINTTLDDQENVNKMLESVNILKRAICTVTLPAINGTSPDTLTYAVITFCNTNNTVFEVTLQTLNKILTEMMLTKPDEMLSVAGMTVLLFDQLQNETSLWESLLAFPELLSSRSIDQTLSGTKDLLTNIQGALHVIQRNFPATVDSLGTVHPLLAGAINLIHYIQNWPGKNVYISLGEVVMLHNDTLSDIMKQVLQDVEIPLDQAIGLTLDKEMVQFYLCGNSSNPIWLTAACSMGTVDLLLSWISPDKVAKQALLAWSEHVAAHDVSFVKGLLHSLMGGSYSGEHGASNVTRSRRSIDTQPQNIEEELFLGVGHTVLELVSIEPTLDMVVQRVLRTAFQSMKAATTTLGTVDEIMSNVLSDAGDLQLTYRMLMTNQSEAQVWISRVLESVMEMIMKTLESEPLTCEELLEPFEWLLSTKAIKIEVWRSMICQNNSALQQALTMDWMHVVQEVQELYNIVMGEADINVTLPMILSEWHQLYSKSLQFGGFVDNLVTVLGGEYWMNWMPDNSTHNVTGILQQSVFMSLAKLGEELEMSEQWPEVKSYFHMIYWIVNYRPGGASQPANCSVDSHSLALHCETGLKWPQLVEAMAHALMSPSEDVLVNYLKGAVNLLQHVYGDMYTHLAASYLQQEIKGGDALSAYLTNLMLNLDDFVKTISVLPNQNNSDSAVMAPLIDNLLKSTGLSPLLPLLFSEGPISTSMVLDVASKVGRLNQHIFTFNETDPTMPELEQLIMQFLSLEGNLTLSIPHIMGYNLLTYSSSFQPDDVARLKEAIQPFTNQTSAGLADTILSAMELLKTVMNSPDGDPTNIILGYIHQLQEFMISLYRLQKIGHLHLPNGQLNAAQITDLQMISTDFFNLFTTEGLQNLTQAGPDVAQEIVFQKFVAFLPAALQENASAFFQEFKVLQYQISRCAEGQNCLAGVSEIFMFLDEISDMMLSASGNVTIKISPTSFAPWEQEHEEIASMFFSLLLPPNDATNVKTFKQALHFIKLVMSTPSITVSSVQSALIQSNLTIQELNGLAALAGTANINELIVNVMKIVNVQQCFEPQNDLNMTTHCVMGLVNGFSGFLAHIPAVHEETTILSLIPLIVNKTISDIVQVNFSSDLNMAAVQTLNATLDNIKMSLQLSQLNTPEIMNEIKVLEGLIHLVANMEPINSLNTTAMKDPMHAQKVYLELVEWYLKRLENITRNSSASELLQPFFHIIHMQVTSQLAQTDFSLFVSNKVEFLLNNLQYPIDGAGMTKIGLATTEITEHLLDYLKFVLELQSNDEDDQLFNSTLLHYTEFQIELYLNLIETWMKQPNIPMLFTSLLQWGNSSMTASAPVTDLHHLLETMVPFLSSDQLAYLSMISNISQSLSKVLMVAEQNGGLQSEHFIDAISEAVQSAMQILNTVTDPLSPPLQEDILEMLRDSLNLIANPNMSFASLRNISLHILKRAERVMPEMCQEYLLAVIKVVTTYFENTVNGGGPDKWNQIIFDEMKTVQSLLPPNSTAHAYISVVIDITHFILESGQGNTSLWATFAGASLETLPEVIGKIGKLTSMFWQLATGGTGSNVPSLEVLSDLVPVVEQMMTGKADQDTWDKLEEMLEALLSALEETELWNSTISVMPLFENVIGSLVKNMQAENVMIMSLQMPMVTLMRDIALSVNTSHFNLSELSEEMQHAIEHTVKAAQEANGTLNCSEALKAWEPVRQAAGLNHTTLSVWCDISLQPVLEAFAEAQTVYSQLSMSHMGVGPMSASAAADRIVRTVQSLYQVNINCTLVIQQLIVTFSSQLSDLADQSLSPEVETYWYKQLQDMQLQNRLGQMLGALLSALEETELWNSTISVMPLFENVMGTVVKNMQAENGNTSLWATFAGASLKTLPEVIGQIGKLTSMLWQLATGGTGSGVPSLEVLSDLIPVVEQMMTGKAEQDTWDKLEEMLEALLSALEETELWNSTISVMPLFENVIGRLVKNMQAENVMIMSLQMPMVTLMRDIALSVNTSHFNLSELSEEMQHAIEHTVKAAQEANGTLNCSEALKAWEPVRQAAVLNHTTLSVWCDISLQPVLEAFAEAQTVYSQLSMSHMGVGPMSASAAADRIVRTVQSLYQVNINCTLVIQQLIVTFSSQLSDLADQSLSPEAETYWYKQLQDMQLQNSLSSIKQLSDELLGVAPFLQPYIEAAVKAVSLILDNYHLVQNSSSSQNLFREAAMIFLTSANITSDDISYMIGENGAGLNGTVFADMMREVVKLMNNMKLFRDLPMVYQALEQFLAFNDTNVMLENLVEMSVWLTSTQASGLDLLSQTLPRMYDITRSLLSVLTKMNLIMPAGAELYEDIAGNIIVMFRQLVSTGDLFPLMPPQLGMPQSEMTGGHYTGMTRRRRDLSLMMTRDPMDDFIDLFYIDYPTMFRAISVPPTTTEMMETAHVLFANPDLNVVLKGATSDMPWGLNASRETTIDVALGMFSFFTQPDLLQMPPMVLLMNAADMLPDGFPFSSEIKNITRALASESQENLMLMQQTSRVIAELLQISPTDPQFLELLRHLRSQVCTLENTEPVQVVSGILSIEPGQLCHTFLPSLQILVEGLLLNTTSMSDIIFQAVIGDPKSYNVQINWTSVLSQSLDFNTSSLSSLDLNFTSPGVVTVGDMLRNKTAFVLAVQQHMAFNPTALHLLMETALPNNNLEILSWLVNLNHCNSTAYSEMNETDVIILKTFCNMSAEEWYLFSLLMAEHVNTEKALYRMMLSEEMLNLVGILLQMAKSLTDVMNKILPAVSQLQNYLLSVRDLNLGANNEFQQMTRGQRVSISSRSTFVTLSRALCSNGILALFGISKLPEISSTSPSSPDNQQREEMIERFKIPRNATPFCMNMYLDMVNTTGGAIAWAFLKPMLMGHILYTPDTPITRAIMEKANATLQEFANLRKNSEDWIESSNYIIKSAEILSTTLPMLQNSLGNSFVKNFIEMQTDINVDRMKETLSSFSNMTVMLSKNKNILDQITTLSTLMMRLSSCVKFDRYHGYDSVEELNTVAQNLAKNRDLYASVIFKLPKDSSKKREARSSSSSSSAASSLPPEVSYTIRMHMDNVMRTDRVRNPYFVKDRHISASQTMRYNRGFIYLQESIDRAIIETQIGQRVTDLAVQLQPFPYPCHLRDEYLEAISFVFPLMLMIAWVLFVAEFVKKLVHERELRLHEYMKMMGVNPLSHFFAWFLECATYLVMTIFILTLVLKYGKILPNSDGFLIFLYLCDYGLSILAFSYLVSSFFDKTFIAGLSGSLLYILCFFPYIVVMALETNLTFSQKSILSLFSPTCFSYAGQYASRYESQGEGIQWSNSYASPIAGDTASFGWLCWLMLIDSILYFIIGIYIRMVFPGKYGIPAPWYFPFKRSFWAELCCCIQSKSSVGKGLLFANIMQKNQPVFSDDKGKGQSTLSYQAGEDRSELPVGVALHGLTKMYGDQAAIQNLNVSFHEGHVTSLLGHNGAGKTTTMSLLTGLFAPTSGTIQVYGKDMETNIDEVRRELGVCMQYDVLFDHMTAKEHLLLYGQIKAPQWSSRQLHEQVHMILEETGMYAHRHKRVGTLSGGMKRKLSIAIAFIGGSRLVVLDEPTTGVDPCSRRSIWDIVIQYKKHRTIIMSTHHLDEAEVLSDRIAFLERGGLKCYGSPFYLKDMLGQGYKLTLTKKTQKRDSERIDSVELKAFIQAHVPEARMKETQGGDVVYSLPPFTSSNASSYRSLLTSLDANLDDLQLRGYGISDTTLEEVFLQLTHGNTAEDTPLSISETVSDTASIDSFPSDISENSFSDNIKLSSSSTMSGMALAWQQIIAMLIKRFHHSRRDWKGLISQILLPVLFVVFAMGLGSIRKDLQHYPELELSPALYKIGPSYSFFSNQNPESNNLVDSMMSFPGIDNACLNMSDNQVCTRSTNNWRSSGNSSQAFSVCKCTQQEQICEKDSFQPPHKKIPSSQVVYNLTGINTENYLVATANDFIRNRYGGFAFGMPLPSDLQMDLKTVPKNRTLSKVWFNPEGHHTMPSYLNSLNNLILRSNIPADKNPSKYAISVSSHPYFGRADDEDAIVQGMLQILVAMCVLTGYSITTASFAIYEVSEHHSGSKVLQHIAGIGEPLYWAVNFFYDMAIYMIPVTLTIGVVAAFQIPAFNDRQNLAAVTLLLVLFGFATFPWMYLLSGVFKHPEMAFITYVCINLFISINTIISTSVLYFLGQISKHNLEVTHEIFNRLSHAFLIFPQFSFGNGLMQLARTNMEVQILSGYGIDAYKNPFSTESLGWMFLSSLIQGLVFFTLRLLLNKTLMRKVRHLIMGRKTVPPIALEDEDEDVAAEHLRVSSGAASSDLLQVNQLTKVYQQFKKKVHAVKRLSVGIPAGECFGLLGVNGAGKTTTFKMLTGDVSPTDGSAQIKNWDGRLVDIMECRNKGINIGYCPQVDALDDLLTGEEHLYFYARIRGISKREIHGVVNYLLRRLELNYYRNNTTDGYSCGTRRKLSTALALIGHPQILLLDEPSSGMDPRTKRHLWKIISEEVRGKCAVVLTSHSMEECEALCSRLAIMVKGQFQCLGSLQHIKNRFGSGFIVKIYLAEASCEAEAITSFMQRRFPSTYLKDQHSTMVEYHVPVAPGGVADIFDQLESNKNALHIKHFSVSQTTLDEVFINFAMGKIGMETIPIHSEDDSDNLDSIKAVPT
ncbi:ATP-binding cassette sub-family A member 12 isoform X2 [Melanotaenia boesemani]|uniref:ATP-binding cassette sub-family A member 12 isoform X2 n=1 Tax=Melanotaenia boesemani TaxID=1250792 RepID=UPI001C049264|nr:ATP-binding cassette sub-family A member 12 isoform X2 [Melanotaenia boesemani]